MKLLHRMVLRKIPGPFFGALATLLVILILQYLIRYLPDIAGKGLTISTIAELVIYNLAYMFVLAVPMSLLVATVLTFLQLSESRAYMIVNGAGISLPRLLWPLVVVGLMLSGTMFYFNNEILPQANYRVSGLMRDIQRKKPDFALQPGVFYDGLGNYRIRVENIGAGGELTDVKIYDLRSGNRHHKIVTAQRGQMTTGQDRLYFTLYDGSFYHLNSTRPANEREARFYFARHELSFDLEGFSFERRNSAYRSDRTTRTSVILANIDSLETRIQTQRDQLYEALRMPPKTRQRRPEQLVNQLTLDPNGRVPNPHNRFALYQIADSFQVNELYGHASSEARSMKATLSSTIQLINSNKSRADRYRVEVHKKFSLALACLMFVLIGPPIALSVRGSSLSKAGGIALAIFLFYWMSLNFGEKLADRGYLIPWVGMWAANVIIGLMGMGLIAYVTLQLNRQGFWYRWRNRKARTPEAPT